MRSIGLAAAAAVAVPLTVGFGIFLIAWATPAHSGAGLSESNRPIGFIAMSVGAACGWILGTSALFSIFKAPALLPRPARRYAVLLVWGPRRTASSPDGFGLDAPAIAADGVTISVSRLLALAFVELPLLMFLMSLLLGYLLQRAVYRPAEAASVSIAGVVVLAWSLLLVVRAAGRVRSRPASPGDIRER